MQRRRLTIHELDASANLVLPRARRIRTTAAAARAAIFGQSGSKPSIVKIPDMYMTDIINAMPLAEVCELEKDARYRKMLPKVFGII